MAQRQDEHHETDSDPNQPDEPRRRDGYGAQGMPRPTARRAPR